MDPTRCAGLVGYPERRNSQAVQAERLVAKVSGRPARRGNYSDCAWLTA